MIASAEGVDVGDHDRPVAGNVGGRGLAEVRCAFHQGDGGAGVGRAVEGRGRDVGDDRAVR